MKTSIQHLPAIKRVELNTIKGIIVRIARPEKIILIGLYAEQSGSLDFENLSAVVQAYDLLIITRDSETRTAYDIQDRIEGNCIHCAPTTALVYSISYVNHHLLEGNFFFHELKQKGILLFDSGRAFLENGKFPNILQVKTLAEKDFKRWGEQAQSFYKSALFNWERGSERVCVFSLHQAIEQIYQAIILIYTGFKPATHNIDKLRRYTNRLSLELALVFPKDTTKEQQLFGVLSASYIDARYKEEFQVTPNDLQILIERVGRLISVGEQLYRNRLVYLDKLITSGNVF